MKPEGLTNKNQNSNEKLTKKTNAPYFYFDIADPSHERIAKRQEREANERPLAPFGKLTEHEVD